MARLIDADALMETWNLGNAKKYGNITEEDQAFSYDTMFMYEIADMIEDAPTIEADPVKHGKWEFGRQNGAAGYWCTNCKSGFAGENAEWIAKEHDFCPKCGARMDGE